MDLGWQLYLTYLQPEGDYIDSGSFVGITIEERSKNSLNLHWWSWSIEDKLSVGYNQSPELSLTCPLLSLPWTPDKSKYNNNIIIREHRRNSWSKEQGCRQLSSNVVIITSSDRAVPWKHKINTAAEASTGPSISEFSGRSKKRWLPIATYTMQ